MNYPDYQGQIEYSTKIPEKNADNVESESLSGEIKKRLREEGIRLYSHQAEAIDLFLEKKNDTCITTGTASGKTLAYALSIADVLRNGWKRGEKPRALLIYPTKALTRDQKEELEGIFDILGMGDDVNLGIYDGDVSSEKKRKVREEADLILTNFTGLNLYLSHHEKWSRFFENLEIVVIDEAHHYKGLLGMHVAWITRRLRRISRYYSEDPRFILSSATLGNPSEHAENLVGKSFEVVDKDGSERGERELLFWNPPKFHDEIRERRSTHRESSELLAFLVHQDIQTLMFAPSRKMTELDALWSNEVLEDEFEDRYGEIRPYNAGHSKKERRETEKALRSGEVDGVVSTTALELGINIGGIDATVLSGYPGSRISFWQQIGRAGRGTDKVLSVLVPFNSALDQYIVKNPDHLLDEPIEDAVIDLSNNYVYSQHLLSAAEELPLKRQDEELLTERMERAAEMWKREGSLSGNLQRGYRYIRGDFPQQEIDLYSIGKDTFEVKIREEEDIESLPEVERNRAYRDFHPGAIYLHQGEYYKVVEFQKGPQPKVVLEPVDTDYYTTTLRNTDISDVDAMEYRKIENSDGNGSYEVYKGSGKVNIHYFAYKKKRLSDDDLIVTENTGLDPIDFETQVSWIEIPEDIRKDLMEIAEQKVADGEWKNLGKGGKTHYLGALHAAEHSLIHMLPLLMLIDEKDVGGISTNFHPEISDQEDKGAIFIYDGVEGGIGFSHDAYSRFEELAKKSIESLEGCDCQSVRGCPACTYSSDCGNDNKPLNRPLAVKLLKRLVE